MPRNVTPSGPEPEAARRARLAREADFQDRRARSAAPEARSRFYHLADEAYRDYRTALRALKGRRTLVVGCAEGGVTPLARQGIEVTGVDLSVEAIRKLRAAIEEEGLTGRARAEVMDAEDLAFPAASFDAIVCTGVLHHLDVARASRSFARVLRPGGLLLMLEPLAWNPAAAVYRRLTPDQRTPDEHPLRPRDLRLLGEAFEVRSFRAYGLLTLLTLPFAVVRGAARPPTALRRLLARADRALFAALPPARWLAWTCLVEAVRRP